ncbi:hypothetical protein FRC00_009422, partial [Tulasnella sp. 408]
QLDALLSPPNVTSPAPPNDFPHAECRPPNALLILQSPTSLSSVPSDDHVLLDASSSPDLAIASWDPNAAAAYQSHITHLGNLVPTTGVLSSPIRPSEEENAQTLLFLEAVQQGARQEPRPMNPTAAQESVSFTPATSWQVVPHRSHMPTSDIYSRVHSPYDAPLNSNGARGVVASFDPPQAERDVTAAGLSFASSDFSASWLGFGPEPAHVDPTHDLKAQRAKDNERIEVNHIKFENKRCVWLTWSYVGWKLITVT